MGLSGNCIAALEAFYCNNQTPPIFTDKWGKHEKNKN